MFDILIRNGRIVDGTGNPWFPADVGIEHDRITVVGNLSNAEAAMTIDAQDAIVCPGFIDCHSHSDQTILANREATSSVYQGVTTEIVGNCGLGFAPVTKISRSVTEKMVHSLTPEVPVSWSSCGDLLDRIDEGIAINIGYLVAHGAIRRAAMGSADRAPNLAEIATMERLLAESLDAGALGLSFGLEFMPGRLAGRDELLHMCQVAAERGKPTAWHVRDRTRDFEASVNEALSVTRETGAALQLSHLSAKPGSAPRAWNRVMEAVRLARAQGQDVQCDMIPYNVGPGLLAAILPVWATQGTVDEVQARLRDPATRERLIAQSDRYWMMFSRREWDKITLTASQAHVNWVGMTLREIGQATGEDPFDCVYDILADEGEGYEQVWVNGVLFTEGDIIEWLADPLFSIASDGFTSKDHGPLSKIINHPNSFGWTPRVLGAYVHELRTMSLEEAIRKMTSMPATRFGLLDRGLLRPEMMADVAVFNEEAFRTRATYLKPQIYAEGMQTVIVNGQVALQDGAPTDTLAGRVIRP